MTSTSPAALRPLYPGTVVAVAGISQYQDAARDTFIGDEVVLRHETTNPFDTDAVVISNPAGAVIGYVPASGRLNSRLLVGHRGGVWGGVVVERYDGGETIGLRVKILTLHGHRPDAYGSDHPGLRGPCDDPPPTDTPADILTPGSADQRSDDRRTDAAAGRPHQGTGDADTGSGPAATLVYARSRRLLGTLVEVADRKVRVRDADGNVTRFPAGIVILEPAGGLPPAPGSEQSAS